MGDEGEVAARINRHSFPKGLKVLKFKKHNILAVCRTKSVKRSVHHDLCCQTCGKNWRAMATRLRVVFARQLSRNERTLRSEKAIGTGAVPKAKQNKELTR